MVGEESESNTRFTKLTAHRAGPGKRNCVERWRGRMKSDNRCARGGKAEMQRLDASNSPSSRLMVELFLNGYRGPRSTYYDKGVRRGASFLPFKGTLKWFGLRKKVPIRRIGMEYDETRMVSTRSVKSKVQSATIYNVQRAICICKFLKDEKE